jgi:DNA ligase D-like protein (predicted 3'-phosphoesterase)
MRMRTIVITLILFNAGAVMARKLTTYAQKRDFSKTAEPAPTRPRKTRTKKADKPIFVIQRHNASHLHYDLRLEIGGVLVSWAVPKGPPKTTTVKRLAVQTEDHPMAYANFEGVIEEGYGAGTVKIWDKGTYCNLKEDLDKPMSMEESLRKGRIEIYLHGDVLEGPYALVRTAYGGDKKKNWLLMKLKKKVQHECSER